MQKNKIFAFAPRHSFATRFLATVISQKVMVGKTWHEIHAAIAEDCYSLYFDGIKVASFTLFFLGACVVVEWGHYPIAVRFAFA